MSNSILLSGAVSPNYSYLNIVNTSSLISGGDFTISWWQKMTWNRPDPRVFEIGNYPAGIQIGVSIEGYSAGPGTATFYYWNAAGPHGISISNFIGVWCYFSISHVHSTNTTYIHKDGSLINTISDSVNYNTGANNLVIGNESSPNDAAPFMGEIYGFNWIDGTATYGNSDYSVPVSLPSITGQTRLLLTGGNYQGTLSSSVTPNNISTSADVPLVQTICFLEGSKILCVVEDIEVYRPIESLRKGDLVKTLKNGTLPIDLIGKSVTNHALNIEPLDQLFICKKEKYTTLIEDLILTGGHSLLVDQLSVTQFKNMTKKGILYITDDKLRLFVCYDENSTVYEKEGEHTIYHLSLEDKENKETNHGIYANGLLVESCTKECMLLCKSIHIL